MTPKTGHPRTSMAHRTICGTQGSPDGTQDSPQHPRLVVVSTEETNAALVVYSAVLCQLTGLP